MRKLLAAAFISAAIFTSANGELFRTSPLERKGERRRYTCNAVLHGVPVHVDLEMWDESREFYAIMEGTGEAAGKVRLDIVGYYRRERDAIVFEGDYAGLRVTVKESADGSLVPVSSNVPFEVKGAVLRACETGPAQH